MGEYFEAREVRDPAARETELMRRLPEQIARAIAGAPYYADRFAGIAPGDVATRATLARLPVTRKHELMEVQRRSPPFGGLNATSARELVHLFRSPGPICEPEGRGENWFRMARALFAAGIRPGDIVHNCFSYHFTPAGAMVDTACRALGCPVFPGGVGQTEMQVEAIAHFRADAYVGTPDFIKIILDKAGEMGADVGSLSKALVGGGALFPSLRRELEGHGLNVRQCYGTADVGLIAYESEAMEGMILDEDVIVEIVRPGTGDPVPEGEVGEVVVTTFNPDYPMIRFGTGDLSAIMPGTSPCGRTAPRIRGWLGRADQTAKVRGMFVRPEQIARVLARHPEIVRARLVVGSANNLDTAVLRCETSGGGGDLAHAIGETMQVECRVRGQVELVPVGSLPNDGKVIEDIRTYT